MKLGGPDDEASCRVALQVSVVSKNFVVGKMVDTGNYRLELDADRKWWNACTTPGEIETSWFNFCQDACEVRPQVHSTEPVPRMLNGFAPLPEVKDDLRQDVAAPAVDTARPPDRPGLRAWSPVDPDREILCLLHGPVNVLEFEEVARKEAALKRELDAELDARRQGPLEQERVASVLPAPESRPHVASKPWCNLGQMDK